MTKYFYVSRVNVALKSCAQKAHYRPKTAVWTSSFKWGLIPVVMNNLKMLLLFSFVLLGKTGTTNGQGISIQLFSCFLSFLFIFVFARKRQTKRLLIVIFWFWADRDKYSTLSQVRDTARDIYKLSKWQFSSLVSDKPPWPVSSWQCIVFKLLINVHKRFIILIFVARAADHYTI